MPWRRWPRGRSARASVGVADLGDRDPCRGSGSIIDHPSKPELHAEAGHDPILGYFVDVMRGHRLIKSYDFFAPSFNRARPLMGCLDFLASEGFFTGEQLEDALIAIQDGEEDVPSGVQQTVDVVMAFKLASD